MVRRTDRPLLQVRVSFETTRLGPQHLIVRPARADSATPEPTAETQRCATRHGKNGGRGGIRR
jgi:hypothetical protein